MKKLKKPTGLILAIVMALSLATTAFADEPSAAAAGQITINNAVDGQVYSIYRIFDLESYDAEVRAYSYKVNENWESFFGEGGAGSTYVTFTGDYVELKDGITEQARATLANLALTHVATSSPAITATKSIEAQTSGTEQTTTVVFDNLPLGYYLVDSTVGAVCSLTAADPMGEITDKNLIPSVEKNVEEDSTGAFDGTDDADIGQIVNFKATIHVGDIPTKSTATAFALASANVGFIFHDEMSNGLTFKKDSVAVTLNNTAVDGTIYDLVEDDLGDDCTFHVQFSTAWCDELEKSDAIIITYSATLNADAVVGGSGNPNSSKVSYGDNHGTETKPSTTTTYTWGVDLFKYTGSSKTALPGAKFVLYKQEGNEKKYATVVDGKLTGWVMAESYATELSSGADGFISVDGLDSDTYYFKETKAPDGYNLVADPVMFKISDDGKITVDDVEVNQVEVENKSGSILPETGGIGTTIFYIIGGLLVVGASVLLITKRRMNAK